MLCDLRLELKLPWCGSTSTARNCPPSEKHAHTQQIAKNLLAMQETQVRALDQEDSLEKGLATHSSILAWKIPRTQEPGGLQSMVLQRVRHD